MAGGMIALVLIAALVFDIGQNLVDRRAQQNASDAAALAGARFMALPGCKPVGGVQPPCSAARLAALDVAAQNGYVDGVDGHTVEVHIPPNAQSQFNRFPGHIQVVIGGTRGSFFSGVIGTVSQNVDTQAVAANIEDFSLPFALLALNESKCGSVHITGNGTLNINADIQVNSTCNTSGAFQIGGSGATVNAATADCSAVGTIKVNSGTLNCNRQEGVEPQLFPAIGGPGILPTPATPTLVGGITTGPMNKRTVSDTCPGQGANAATLADPKQCKIQSGKPATAQVHLYPGMYPGGLLLTQAPGDAQLSVYLEPGIYYMAGGGLEIRGNIVLRSVEAGGTVFNLASPTMGVMIYNSDNPQFHDDCVSGAAAGLKCIDTIDFQTGASSDVDLRGVQIDTSFKNLLLFQDPDASDQPPVSMEGHSSQTFVGTIYLPEAEFAYHGNGAGEALQAQAIVDTFTVTGNGTVTINYDAATVYQFKGIGLVQ